MQTIVIEQIKHLVHHLLCRSSTAYKRQMGCSRLAPDTTTRMSLTIRRNFCRIIKNFCRVHNRDSNPLQPLRLPLRHQIDGTGAHREIYQKAIPLQILCRFFQQGNQRRRNSFRRSIHTCRSIQTDYHRTFSGSMGKAEFPGWL